MVDNSFTSGFLIDGFPREIKQGKQFEKEVIQIYLACFCFSNIICNKYLRTRITVKLHKNYPYAKKQKQKNKETKIRKKSLEIYYTRLWLSLVICP